MSSSKNNYKIVDFDSQVEAFSIPHSHDQTFVGWTLESLNGL